MTDREALYEGLSNTAWGYFFLFINFNLTINAVTINVLPQFAGCLLLLSAIKKLTPERRDLALLRPLCVLLTVWHLASWTLALFGVKLEEMDLVFLDLLVLAATLYFHFQYLTDIAALAEKYQSEEERLDRNILRYRTALIVLLTASNVTGYLDQLLEGELTRAVLMAAVVCLLIAMVILIVLLMMALFRLRRDVRDGGTGLGIGPE